MGCGQLCSQVTLYRKHITNRCFNSLKCALNISGNDGVVQQGWHNKTTCIHKAFQKVQCLTNFPVYILHIVILIKEFCSNTRPIYLHYCLYCMSLFISFTIWEKGSLAYLCIIISTLQAPKTINIIKRRALQGTRVLTSYFRKKKKKKTTRDGEPLFNTAWICGVVWACC